METRRQAPTSDEKAVTKGVLLVELDGVAYSYKTPSGTVKAVKRASGGFRRGLSYAIVGRSGSGKSTLLSLIAGLGRPDAGTITFDGRPLKEVDLDDYRGHKVGLVFQAFHLLSQLTGFENVRLGLELSGWPARDRNRRSWELLEKVGIDRETAGRRALRLSGGEQQRIAIARALGPDPALILADEPTGNLDAETSDDIVSLLLGLAKDDGRCVIIATHAREVARSCDEVWTMQSGVLLPWTGGRE